MAGTMLRTRGERLRAARLKHFKSARLAAIALRIPVSTYGAHERAQAPGGRDYGPEEATRYGRRFGVMPEWLLTGWCPPQQERDGETTVRLHEEDVRALKRARHRPFRFRAGPQGLTRGCFAVLQTSTPPFNAALRIDRYQTRRRI